MKIPFDPFYFAIGIFLGLLYNYLRKPAPEIVYKYPTPDNAGTIVYKDQAGVCYKYRAQKVDCSPDSVKQPIQN